MWDKERKDYHQFSQTIVDHYLLTVFRLVYPQAEWTLLLKWGLRKVTSVTFSA